MHILLVNLGHITEKFDISHVLVHLHKLNVAYLLVREYISEPGLHSIGIKKSDGKSLFSMQSHFYTIHLCKDLQKSITRLSNLISQSVFSQSLALPVS